MDSKDYDTYNLRFNASFKTLIGKDVYWVPVNELGKTRYTNYEISKLLVCTPDEKKRIIGNLYEAIQLFQISGFKENLDVVLIRENGVTWEHHKPGYYSVLSNHGCCSSVASWLNYMLKDSYDEVGLISFSRPDGSGHVFNYIHNEGWYYIVDLNPMIEKYSNKICVESGLRKDFARSKYITSVCVKTRDLKSYAEFFNRMIRIKGHRFLFFKQSLLYAAPMHVETYDEYVNICYPDGCNISCLNGDFSSTKIKYAYIQPPKIYPTWKSEEEGYNE